MKLPGLSDIEIWSLFKKGDDQALSFIYTENSVKLYQYGLKFTPDNTMVEDSIHDLFVELIKNRKTLGDTENILFYLLKAYKRKLLKKLQKGKRLNLEEDMETQNFEIIWSIEYEIILEEITEHKSKLLLKVLKKLTPRQKEAIYLRFSKELNYKEIAGIMDISIEACRNLICGAVKAMKESIRKESDNPLLLLVGFFRCLDDKENG